MKKILVIQTAFIGDAILTLPMIQKLKVIFPESIIDIICIPSASEIFLASPSVNKILLFDKKNKHKSFKSLIQFAKEVKNRSYDVIYSPHRSIRSALLVLLSGVRETYGFSTSSFKHIYKYNIDYHLDKHEIQRNLDLIEYDYSDEDWRIIPLLNMTPEAINNVNKYMSANGIGKNFVAVAPGSVWQTKRYPAEYFSRIIDFLISENFQVVITGGIQDQEIASEIIRNKSKNVFNAAGKFTLIESIQLLKSAILLITNDSAPTHLGMCADIKVLTIYCSTVPEFGFYPYNNFSRYLSYNDLYCKPCGIHGYNKCPIDTFECGFKLTSDNIIDTIKEMISIKN